MVRSLFVSRWKKNKVMKKYVKLIKHKEYWSYDSFANDKSLWILSNFFHDAYPDFFIKGIEIEMIAGTNTVSIFEEDGYVVIVSGLPPYPEDEFLIELESFKQMIWDWKALRDKKASEIFIVYEPKDKTAAVFDHLKEDEGIVLFEEIK